MKTREEVEATIVHGKELGYWKNNAEEDYMKVPISVLKYITVMEELLSQEQDMRDTIIQYEQWKEDGDIKNLTAEQTADWFIEEHAPKPKQ